MKFIARTMALMVALTAGSIAHAEDAVEATKTAPALSLFPEASVYVWTYYYLNAAGHASNDFVFYPHFATPILNKFATLDAFMSIAQEADSVHLKQPTVYIDITKEFVANDYVNIAPYIELVNPGREKGAQAWAFFFGMLQMPMQTSAGKFAAYVYTESGMGVNMGKTDLAANYKNSASGLNLTGEEVEKLGLKAAVEGKATKYPISTYSRAAVSYEPSAVKGLKAILAANVIASPSDNYTLDSKDKKILDVESKWGTTTQALLRLEYKINDTLTVRNETTHDFKDYFVKSTDAQDKAGVISNMTRLTYTFF